ncbi:MAG: NTP transferase domain-containing protein, partial [Thermomicrobiales bacterium]
MKTTIRHERDEPPSDNSAGRRCAVVVLAAGQGTRMKSGLLKMLHPIAGRPMIDAVIGAARGAEPAQ